MLGYMAQDQYGTTWHLGNCKHPRKKLLELLRYKKASKIYQDPGAQHIGWRIGPHWVTVYRVYPLTGN